MKILTLLTSVALACYSLNAHAQIQILSGTPTLAPRLVGDQTPLAEVTALPFSDENQQELPNPFDYFSDEQDTTPKHQTQTQPQPQAQQSEQLSTEAVLQPSPHDPSSLPVAKTKRSIVETIVDQGVLTSVANASHTPVHWGGTPQTPNPVAEWLLREQCVQGLWANYPQQRAAECAQMWSRLAGHSCAKGACGVQGPCSVCSQPVRNRYTEERVIPSCTSSTDGSCGVPGCSQCAQMKQPQSVANVALLPKPTVR